jgi:hypothetical protein
MEYVPVPSDMLSANFQAKSSNAIVVQSACDQSEHFQWLPVMKPSEDIIWKPAVVLLFVCRARTAIVDNKGMDNLTDDPCTVLSDVPSTNTSHKSSVVISTLVVVFAVAE